MLRGPLYRCCALRSRSRRLRRCRGLRQLRNLLRLYCLLLQVPCGRCLSRHVVVELLEVGHGRARHLILCLVITLRVVRPVGHIVVVKIFRYALCLCILAPILVVFLPTIYDTPWNHLLCYDSGCWCRNRCRNRCWRGCFRRSWRFRRSWCFRRSWRGCRNRCWRGCFHRSWCGFWRRHGCFRWNRRGCGCWRGCWRGSWSRPRLVSCCVMVQEASLHLDFVGQFGPVLRVEPLEFLRTDPRDTCRLLCAVNIALRSFTCVHKQRRERGVS